MFNYTLPQWIRMLFSSLTWKVKTSEPKVYLTFDDGPHPRITPWVMDELDRSGAKATFFCVGDNIKKYPEIYSEILQRGHRTGNHTQHHLNGWKTENASYFADIAACAELVKSDLFRPPYGRLRPSQIKVLKSKYRIIMWDFLTKDYDKMTSAEKMMKAFRKHAGPGSIIVLHDSEKAEAQMRLFLPEILHYCQEKGFTFETL